MFLRIPLTGEVYSLLLPFWLFPRHKPSGFAPVRIPCALWLAHALSVLPCWRLPRHKPSGFDPVRIPHLAGNKKSPRFKQGQIAFSFILFIPIRLSWKGRGENFLWPQRMVSPQFLVPLPFPLIRAGWPAGPGLLHFASWCPPGFSRFHRCDSLDPPGAFAWAIPPAPSRPWQADPPWDRRISAPG